MVMRDILPDRMPQVSLSAEDHPFQALLVDGLHEAFRVRGQIRALWRQLHRPDPCGSKDLQEMSGLKRITIARRNRAPRRNPSRESVELRASGTVDSLQSVAVRQAISTRRVAKSITNKT
jgi:hypothetical protein